jgi:ABC-type uncharacterized transport system permease subunit
MNSRLSEIYNRRAAELSMIPGYWYGIPVNKYEGGESVIVEPNKGLVLEKVPTNMNLVPTTNDLVKMRDTVVTRYTTKPLATTTTFTGVLGADKLNTQVTQVKKSALPVDNFNIIDTEKYPEPPVLWMTTIGAPSRLFNRPDGNRYRR